MQVKFSTVLGIAFLFLLPSSGCIRKRFLDSGDFRNIAIYYSKTNKNYTKKYQAFRLWKEPIDSLGLSIYYVFPEINAYTPTLEKQSQLSLPTHFVIIGTNTYFWRENASDDVNNETINQLSTLGLIDSTNIKVELGVIGPEDVSLPSVTWDETTKAAKYVFCNSNGKFVFKLISAHDISTETLRGLHCK